VGCAAGLVLAFIAALEIAQLVLIYRGLLSIVRCKKHHESSAFAKGSLHPKEFF